MITADEIREIKEHYINDLYQNVRKEQKTDQSYRDDTFTVDEIKEPHVPLRSGFGARMVDAPAEQIITRNPQVFIKVLKGEKESGQRIGELFNQEWFKILRRQNPNPFKEYLKNLLGRGEAYLQVVHNQSWVTGQKNRYGLPVLFLVPDPMVIYGSPEEDDFGVPLRVVVFYERQYKDVILRYKGWSNPEKRGTGVEGGDKSCQWMEYWDKDARYFEADGEAVLPDGVQENSYHFVPFIRQRSGFGRRSPEGKLEDLIVSDIRLSRDLIKEECVKRSNIASVENLFAHRPRVVISPGEIDREKFDEISWGAYDVVILDNVPEGTKIESEEATVPPPEMYQSLAAIRAELNQRNPFIMAGFPFGASGRQQDLTASAAMRRYDTVIENTENAFATAFEMALKIIKQIPTLKPDPLQKKDLETIIECEVKLKADDPVEADRRATLGDRLWNRGEGCIDLRTNLIEYQGKTEDEAEDIIANILVDRLTIYNPDVAGIMGMEFAEEAGLERYMAKLQQMRMMQTQEGATKPPSATETKRRKGEVETERGREEVDMSLSSKGARFPPERYR